MLWRLYWEIQVGIKWAILGRSSIIYFLKLKRIDVAGFVVFLIHSIHNLLSIGVSSHSHQAKN